MERGGQANRSSRAAMAASRTETNGSLASAWPATKVDTIITFGLDSIVNGQHGCLFIELIRVQLSGLVLVQIFHLVLQVLQSFLKYNGE